uniref:Uncharacterized protein n=1 Tax=Anguilla anguilla TaxID=7936 RepID=A0A0E9QCU3_ANGAN
MDFHDTFVSPLCVCEVLPEHRKQTLTFLGKNMPTATILGKLLH